MSETPAEATTPVAEPAFQAPAAAAPAPTSEKPPPWGSPEEFNPEIAWERIQKQSADIARLKSVAKTPEDEQVIAQWRQLEEASKTELQRAQEAAKSAEDRAAATLSRVATAELKAALTGVVPDPAGLIEDLNVAKFITADGNVDEAAIQQLRAKYAAFTPQAGPRPNPAQGGSAFGTPTAADQIREAEKAGDFKRAMSLKAQQLLDAAQNQ
jgi:hypothetical protein